MIVFLPVDGRLQVDLSRRRIDAEQIVVAPAHSHCVLDLVVGRVVQVSGAEREDGRVRHEPVFQDAHGVGRVLEGGRVVVGVQDVDGDGAGVVLAVAGSAIFRLDGEFVGVPPFVVQLLVDTDDARVLVDGKVAPLVAGNDGVAEPPVLIAINEGG